MTLRMAFWLCLFLLVPWRTWGAEGEWSRFRGPNGSGISEATTIPVHWTEKDYNWKIALPGIGHSSPVVWGQRIFVTCGDPVTAQRLILCLDTATGRKIWQRTYPSKTYSQHRDSAYATATPAVDGEMVVVTWTTPESVILLALDHTGRELWRRDLGPFVTLHGSGISPILYEDLVVLNNDQEDPSLIPSQTKKPSEPPGKSFILAVERTTGKTRWQIERRTTFSAYSTPCVFRPEKSPPQLIFTTTAHGIMGVDPIKGRVLWEIGQPFLDRAVSSPVVTPELVIAGHGAGFQGVRYLGVRPGMPEKKIEPAVVLTLTKSLPLVPTPLVKDNRLYLWGDDGIVSCLKLPTGDVLWQERVGGSYFASPVCVDHRLYGIAKNGNVVVLACGNQFKVLSRVSLGEPTFATPAIAGGVMYLRTQQHLISLGGKRG